jgi:hypothetical protein
MTTWHTCDVATLDLGTTSVPVVGAYLTFVLHSPQRSLSKAACSRGEIGNDIACDALKGRLGRTRKPAAIVEYSLALPGAKRQRPDALRLPSLPSDRPVFDRLEAAGLLHMLKEASAGPSARTGTASRGVRDDSPHTGHATQRRRVPNPPRSPPPPHLHRRGRRPAGGQNRSVLPSSPALPRIARSPSLRRWAFVAVAWAGADSQAPRTSHRRSVLPASRERSTPATLWSA